MKRFNIQGALLDERQLNWYGRPIAINIKSHTGGICFVEVNAINNISKIKIT